MRRLLVVVLFVCLLLAGCKVDTTLTIDVDDDGSGTVRVRVALDAEAVQNAQAGGGTLEERVRLGDLQAAGWTVSLWRRAPGGEASISLRKRFANADDLARVVAELNGDAGPLRDLTLERDRGLLFTEYKVTGDADLSQLTANVSADPELVAQLTAQRVDLAQIDQRLTQQINDAFRLRIRLVFPGGEVREIRPEPGKKVSLATSTSQLDTTRALFLAAAVVLGVVGIVVLVRGELRGRRRLRRGRPAG
jgi:muconolactone delta-isomerase